MFHYLLNLSDNFANALGYKLVNDKAQFYLNYIVDSSDYKFTTGKKYSHYRFEFIANAKDLTQFK